MTQSKRRRDPAPLPPLQYLALVHPALPVPPVRCGQEEKGEGEEGEEEGEMSASLPAWAWKDPARAYERTEAATCQGCIYLFSYHIAGSVAPSCAKGRIVGVKCKAYREEVRG